MVAALQLVAKLASLAPALPQSATNGKSDLGTLNAPALPAFLPESNLKSGELPWGNNRTAVLSNPYEDSPTTGVVRTYDFTISRGNIAPDGVNKSVLLVNGAFPGPTIEANWGDTFEITVHNDITGPEEGTAIHWHGIMHRDTPEYDGVPAVTQCPIAPGKSLTYRFKADLYGTSWYHSHYSAQYAGGLFGPMIIYGPELLQFTKDLGPVLLSDWYHGEYFDLVEQTMAPNANPVFSDNNLINGKGIFDCSAANGAECTPNAGLSKFNFTSGGKFKLRLINGGAEGLQRFSIDDHEMTIVANDFVPVAPYKTKVVTLGIGQRTDVIVEAKLAPDAAVFMRSSIATCGFAKQPLALAAIYYEKADRNKVPTSQAQVLGTDCANDDLDKTVPLYPFETIKNPATTKQVDLTAGPNKTGSFLWYMNGESFRGNYNQPVLLLANAGNISYPDDPQWNVQNFDDNGSVRIVLNNTTPAAHPMHLHGHNFNVLAAGPGDWDGKINHIQNTQRRDVQIVPPNGHLVVQYNTDNPGVWSFHCHIAWHVSAGLYLSLMEQPEKIKQRKISEDARQTCRDWWSYSGSNVVEQIDSGL